MNDNKINTMYLSTLYYVYRMINVSNLILYIVYKMNNMKAIDLIKKSCICFMYALYHQNISLMDTFISFHLEL